MKEGISIVNMEWEEVANEGCNCPSCNNLMSITIIEETFVSSFGRQKVYAHCTCCNKSYISKEKK